MSEQSNTTSALIAQLFAAYGLTVTDLSAPEKGYRNASYRSGGYNLILYKSEPGIVARIRRANAVGAAVAKAGLPARSPADQRVLQLAAGERRKYAGLYHYLPGHTIPWEAYTMDHLKELGKVMSDMHAALAAFPAGVLPSVAHESLALNKRMLRYFTDTNVVQALKQKLGLRVAHADFTSLLTATDRLPAQQALHMDFVRGNILFDDTPEVTGILDFEKTARGHKLYDVARTLAFLLVDCKYKHEAKVRKYVLHSGYRKRGTSGLSDITIDGVSVLESLVDFFLLHDFYKFLRHNPYESLPQNEHFMRTKAMLLKRRLIAAD